MTVAPIGEERNREGHADFDISWHWGVDNRASGFTAVLRVKDEAHNLPWVLPGLLRSVEHITLVDNGSTDDTAGVAHALAHALGRQDRLEVLEYPFAVSRCGSEHLHTPADSVHSLTYYYNWAFSKVRTRYAMKWDGDMVLTSEGEQIMRDLAWQVEASDVVVRVPHLPAYIESRDVAYLNFGHRHHEPYAWPNSPAFRFTKGFEWEVLVRPDDMPMRTLPPFICFELKWLDADEFTNWTAQDFVASERAGRKQRDFRVFNQLRTGAVPNGLVRVERGHADHVIDVIRSTGRAHWETLAQGMRRAAPDPAVG